jgi:hypothetical protein
MESYDDAIVEFLADPTNIRIGLEIAERMEDVKKALERKFWETLERKLRENLTLPTGWGIQLNRDRTGREIEINSGLAIYPENPPGQYLYPCIAGDELWYGFAWGAQGGRSLLQKEVTRLRQMLQEEGYNEHSWWLAYKKVAGGLSLRTNQTYVRIATDDHLALVEELTSNLKELFEARRTMIEDANRAIAVAIS